MAEKAKKVSWVLDKTSSTISVDMENSFKAELESRFQFKLVIYKDPDTHIESMKITNYKDGVENGSIVTSVVDLGRDIKDLKKFGVVIGDSYFRDLVREIEEHYLDIQVSTVSFSQNDNRLNELLDQIRTYFSGLDAYIDKNSCYIPVNDFNGLVDDCGYSDYEMRTLREQLVQNGYIQKTTERYTMLKRIKKDKPERVVAFNREKLGIELPKKKGGNSPVKGEDE